MNIENPPPLFQERRKTRQAPDRRLTIFLAIFIGFMMGGSAWMIAGRNPSPALDSATITDLSALSVSSAKSGSDSAATDSKSSDSPKMLSPHKALYNVALTKSKNGSQIIDIKGQMFFQLQRSCNEYVTDHRFTLTYEYADSDPLRVTSDFSTAERLDGKVFDFSARRRRNGELYQELRGKADQAPPQGFVTYTDPEPTDSPLPTSTLFPAAHTLSLIQAAQSGKRFVLSTIFDGSDTNGPTDVTAIISPYSRQSVPVSSGARSAAIDRTLTDSKSWKMRLAFFPKNIPSETSDYELTMILHENGIISEMTIDYPDFTVSQTLTALEPLSVDTCDNMKTRTTSPDTTPSRLGDRPYTSSLDEQPKPVPDLPLR